jgi:hypothetical protein
LASNTLDPISRVCITTIQRLFSMLKGEPNFDSEAEEASVAQVASLFRSRCRWAADDIVQFVREEFAKGNDFAQKITYRTGLARVVKKVKQEDGSEIEQVTYVNSGQNPEDLLSSFRYSYNPQVVTVDMIATGTDVKPLEVVFFMRDIRSLNYFEQMKGRGVRVISDNDFQAVTPEARSKKHFVLVDALGLCTESMVDPKPLKLQPTVSFEKIIEAVAFGNRDKDVLSSLASRLARLDRRLTKEDRAGLQKARASQTSPMRLFMHLIPMFRLRVPAGSRRGRSNARADSSHYTQASGRSRKAHRVERGSAQQADCR